MSSDKYFSLIAGWFIGAVSGFVFGSVWVGTGLLEKTEKAAKFQMCAPKCPEGFEPTAHFKQDRFECTCKKEMEVK